MTGYTVHTGSNDKFRDGWDRVFKTPARKPIASKSHGKDAVKKPRPRSK